MKLHIVPDEKVVNRAIKYFNDVFPNENTFIVLKRKNGEQPRYVKKASGVFFLEYNTRLFWETIGEINKYQHIIIHFLRGDSVRFLNKIEHSSIYWIAWGADIYNGLLEERGFELYAQKNILWKVGHRRIPYCIYKWIYRHKRKKDSQFMLSAARKVRYFVPDSMYDEYPLLLSYYPELSHLCYKDFFYYPIDEILGDNFKKNCAEKGNIIIGNSASLTGNHLHIFNLLQKFNLKDRDIIVPLNYGNKKYAELVEKNGIEYWGEENFHALKHFLPIDKYNEILLSANIFIYGNWRQEAVGNILIALYIGGKVFLDSHNPLLKFYRSLGLVLFDIQELNEEQLNLVFSKDIIFSNRKILEKLYSKKRLKDLIFQNFQ